MKWNGVLAIEEEETEDGRLCVGGSLTWKNPPLPLLWRISDSTGHNLGRTVGMIDEIWRDGYVIKGRGRVFGRSLLRHLKSRHNRVGLGMDLGECEVESENLLAPHSRENPFRFTEGVIVSAWIEDDPAWPGCYLEGH